VPAGVKVCSSKISSIQVSASAACLLCCKATKSRNHVQHSAHAKNWVCTWLWCLQVQDAVMNCQLPTAPHIVAPIREHGSSSIALKYLQDLSQRLAGARPAPSGAGAAASVRAWFKKGRDSNSSSSSGGGVSSAGAAGNAAVVKPEFLVFRDVTSAVLAQVRWRAVMFGIAFNNCLIVTDAWHEQVRISAAALLLQPPCCSGKQFALVWLLSATALQLRNTSRSITCL
jgi:hypothetical protein